MILVLTGTQNIPFKRMIDPIVEFSKVNSRIDFFIQCGPYVSSSRATNVVFKSFTSNEEMSDLIEKSDIVVTHAGTGSIVTSLLKGKKVIVMPRKKKYAEHNDDHQTEIAEMFESEELIVHWREGEEFSDVFNRLNGFAPKKYQSGFDSLSSSIERYICSLGL